MTLGYFDTSALMRWAEGRVDTPRELNLKLGKEIEALLEDNAVDLAVSEITLLEYRASVARAYRTREHEEQFSSCDATWARAATLELMQLIADSRIRVIKVPMRAAEQAMALVDLAAEKGAGGIGIWDAIHLLTAADWASREGTTARLYTSDPDYGEFYEHYPDFERFVSIVKLQDLAAAR